MKNLYLKIVETFKNNRDSFVKMGLLPVETIDLYDGQPDEPNNFEFTCPAVFVGYGIEWERGGSGIKKGVVEIELHILTHPGFSTENFSPRLTDGLQKLEYYGLITDLMESVATENSPNLALIEERPAFTDYFCYHILKFNTVIYRNRQNKYKPVTGVNAKFNFKQ